MSVTVSAGFTKTGNLVWNITDSETHDRAHVNVDTGQVVYFPGGLIDWDVTSVPSLEVMTISTALREFVRTDWCEYRGSNAKKIRKMLTAER